MRSSQATEHSKPIKTDSSARVPGVSAEKVKELLNILSLNVVHGKTSETLTLKKTAAPLNEFCRTDNREKAALSTSGPEVSRYETRFHLGIQIRNLIPSWDPDSKSDSIEGYRFETRFHRG
ncbi:hypothetical protein AVEN_144876-1, partial [Araneus ventricosus]